MVRSFLVVTVLLSFAAVSAADIILLGDSIVADNSSPRSHGYPIYGWGELLPSYLPAKTIHNHASSGASSRSYYRDYWSAKGWPFSAPVVDLVSPGDFVLIQFGHNDLPVGQVNASKAVADMDEYQSWLTLLIDETRAAGAHPILVTPTESWTYAISGGVSQPYKQRTAHANAMQDVGITKDAPVIDLNAYSFAQYQIRTEAEANADFQAQGPHPTTGLPLADKSHPSETGAGIFADYVSREFATASAAAVTAVPEPSAGLLLGLVGCMLASVRRWRKFAG